MTGRQKRVVLARDPRVNHQTCAVGPVYTDKGAYDLWQYLYDAGWEPQETVPLHSVADIHAGGAS